MAHIDESEREFIEMSLAGRAGVEVHETDTSLSVVTKPKKKKKPLKAAKQRLLTYVIASVFTLPFLLSGIFFVALYRVQSFLGGAETLDWLSKQEITPEIEDIVANAGFDWLPEFLAIYANRGIIIASIFTVCFLIVAALVLYDVNRSKKYDEDEDLEKSKDDED